MINKQLFRLLIRDNAYPLTQKIFMEVFKPGMNKFYREQLTINRAHRFANLFYFEKGHTI